MSWWEGGLSISGTWILKGSEPGPLSEHWVTPKTLMLQNWETVWSTIFLGRWLFGDYLTWIYPKMKKTRFSDRCTASKLFLFSWFKSKGFLHNWYPMFVKIFNWRQIELEMHCNKNRKLSNMVFWQDKIMNLPSSLQSERVNRLGR